MLSKGCDNMLVNLKCTIELKGLNDIEMQTVKNTIQGSGIDASIRSDVIFIESDIDNADGYIESLAVYLADSLPKDTQTTITVKSLDALDVIGESLDGYYDILIENGKAYIVPYRVIRSSDKTLYEEVI